MAAEAQLAALLAARQATDKARRAVRSAYDFTGNVRDRVRCSEVSQLVADTLECPRNVATAKLARRLAKEAGAFFTRPNGIHYLAKMRPRAAELVPGDAMPHTPRDPSGVSALRRAWWARLEQEGLREGRTGEGGDLPHYREYARDLNAAYFEKAVSDYWKRRLELDAWGLYALEGLPIRDVAKRLGLTKWAVHQVVQRFAREMQLPAPGQPTEDEETGADEAEPDDTSGS